MEFPPDDPRPTYVQLADALREEIRSGQRKPGERLPSVRELGEQYDVSTVTARNALTLLRDEGWIFSRSTKGYYVRSEPPPERQADLQEGSAAYHALSQQLKAIQGDLQEMGHRLSELEDLVQKDSSQRGPSKR